MHIERRKPGDIQHGLRQDQAISRHGQHIRRESGQFGHAFGIPEVLRLPHGQAQLQRGFLDRTGPQLLATPGRSVRLRIHGKHFAAGPVGQTPQHHGRQLRRAHEDYSAAFRLRHFFTLESYMLRRRRLIWSMNSRPSR